MDWNRKYENIISVCPQLKRACLAAGRDSYGYRISNAKCCVFALFLAFSGISFSAQGSIGNNEVLDSTYQKENVKLHPFTPQNWEKATKGLDYSTEKKKPEEQEKKSKNSFNIDFSKLLPTGKMLQYLFFAVIIIALIFLVITVIRSGLFVSNSKVKNGTSQLLEDLEENLHESDLDKALREALEKKDYRLALRIYYLAIIKELSLQRWIHWRKNKTNNEYVLELKGRPQAVLFSDITLAFERAWYGDTKIDEQSYNTLSPFFSRFIDSIRKGSING